MNNNNTASASWLESLGVDKATRARLEAQLATEATLICLDVVDLIVRIVHQHQQVNTSLIGSATAIDAAVARVGLWSPAQCQLVLTNTMRCVLNALGLVQSANALVALLVLQRSLTQRYGELLFSGAEGGTGNDDHAAVSATVQGGSSSSHCADMCDRLLRHCTSPMQQVRVHASASLYLLMRHNFDIGNNFARLKTQLTVSLSALVAGNLSDSASLTSEVEGALLTSVEMLQGEMSPTTSLTTSSTSSFFADALHVNCLKRSLKVYSFKFTTFSSSFVLVLRFVSLCYSFLTDNFVLCGERH